MSETKKLSKQTEKSFDDRCKAHQSYIEYIKNAKITLRLLEFLRSAVENYNFLQLRNVGKVLSNYMNIRFTNAVRKN